MSYRQAVTMKSVGHRPMPEIEYPKEATIALPHPKQTPERKPMTFQGVQALRGFAAAIVVAFHASVSWWGLVTGNLMNKFSGWWWPGASGVDLFFVISGFVMAVSTYGKRQPSFARQFIKRRAIRLLPMYWIMTTVAAVQTWLLLRYHVPNVTGTFPGPQLTPGFYLSSLTLIPFYHFFPLLVVGWTLSFEALFYLLFTFALSLNIKPLRFLAPFLLLLVAVGRFRKAGWPAVTLLASPLLLEFLAGVVIGEFILQGFKLRARWGLLLAALGTLILLFPREAAPPHRPFTWGMPAALIVLGVASIEDSFGGIWPKWSLLLGDASYSLYLCHVFVIHPITRAIEYSHFIRFGVAERKAEILIAAICLTAAIPVSILLFEKVERPMTNYLRRRLLHEGT